MNIYQILKESEDKNIFSIEELPNLFSYINNKALLQIVVNDSDKDEQSDIAKISEIIVKARDDYFAAKKNDNLEKFCNNLNKDIKKEIKSNRKEVKEDLLIKMDYISKSVASDDTSFDSPNVVIFKLFLNEYNNKYSFTWRSFKELKREYEKSHVLEGENIYSLKSLLEKDPKIEKITNTTVFCKSANTLSSSILEKIKNKIG